MSRQLGSSSDIPSIEVLLAESLAELLLRRTYLAYDLGRVEGQLMERTSPEDDLSGWRRKAKTKAHYLRSSLATLNNVIGVKQEQRRNMWSDDDRGVTVVDAFIRLGRLWEAANAYIESDSEQPEPGMVDIELKALIRAVHEARDVYFQVASG